MSNDTSFTVMLLIAIGGWSMAIYAYWQWALILHKHKRLARESAEFAEWASQRFDWYNRELKASTAALDHLTFECRKVIDGKKKMNSLVDLINSQFLDAVSRMEKDDG